MISYLVAFIFYTLAMVGILLLGFVVYKKFNFQTKQENRGMINIVDSCPIGAKKSLLVVKIGNEKFLIASGLEHTTFLAKLDTDVVEQAKNIKNSTPMPEIPTPLPKQNKNEEKDIYEFLYSQSKKLENQKQSINDENTSFQNTLKNSQNTLKELYMTKSQPKEQSMVASRKKLMQELLQEIHQTKLKTGSKF